MIYDLHMYIKKRAIPGHSFHDLYLKNLPHCPYNAPRLQTLVFCLFSQSAIFFKKICIIKNLFESNFIFIKNNYF